MQCFQTVYPGDAEVCDGRDNTCNGLSDEYDPGLVFPMVFWKQGGFSGWQLLATYDQGGPVADILNYTPDGPDDRIGSTNIVLPDGTAIQEKVNQGHVFAYRDVDTGKIFVGYFFGKDTDVATYDPNGDLIIDTFNPPEVDVDLEESAIGDLDHVYVAWYDDRAPGSTSDRVMDEYLRDTEEFDARFFSEIRDGRTESDGWVLGSDWGGGTERMSFFIGDRSVPFWSSSMYEGNFLLHRPANTPASMTVGFGNFIYMKIVESIPEDSVCESPGAPTAAGCELSRYACNGGVTVCENSIDPACNTCFDLDNDGVPGFDPTTCPAGNDCDDEDPAVFPGNAEICDGLDNDCDGEIDITVQMDGSRQGPALCGGAIACVCPDGPIVPEHPNRECYCGESLAE